MGAAHKELPGRVVPPGLAGETPDGQEPFFQQGQPLARGNQHFEMGRGEADGQRSQRHR
ncbi:MAG: hypothetical protein R2932_52785 [Caldilineaceae bacterium]